MRKEQVKFDPSKTSWTAESIEKARLISNAKSFMRVINLYKKALSIEYSSFLEYRISQEEAKLARVDAYWIAAFPAQTIPWKSLVAK